MRDARLLFRAGSVLAVLLSGLSGGGAAAQVTNGSFETGDFSGWATADLGNPLTPLHVAALGEIGYFGASSAPTDGHFSAVTGFDGAGPGDITLSQDLTVSKSSPLLLLDYLAQWDMLNLVQNSTLDRTFSVVVHEAGGGSELRSIEVLRAKAATAELGTVRTTAAVDLSAFAGQAVQVGLVWHVPEVSTGPGAFELDHVRLVGAKVAAPQTLSLKVALDFAKAAHDSVKLDLVVAVPQPFDPTGQMVSVTVGDLTKDFTLDAKGAAASGNDSVKLLPVAGQDGLRRLVLSCTHGDFLADFAGHGLTEADTPKSGLPVQVPVSVDVGGTLTERAPFLLYKAVAGKSGKASGKAASESWKPKLSVKLNLALADEDSMSLKTIAITGAEFTPDGQTATVVVGGVTKTFTLDGNGKAVNGEDSLTLKQDGKHPERRAVTLKCAHGNFIEVSDFFVLIDADTPKGGLDIDVPVSVTLDGHAAESVVTVKYTAKAGKTGSAKG